MKLLVIMYFTLFSAGAAATSPTAKIKDIAWLSGEWLGDYHGLPMEVYNGPATGGLMLGHTKIVDGEGVAFYEFEKIEEVGESLVLTALPFAQPGVSFPLISISSHQVVFENLKNEFPSRVSYTKVNADQINAKIEGTENEHPLVEEFVYRRRK